MRQDQKVRNSSGAIFEIRKGRNFRRLSSKMKNSQKAEISELRPSRRGCDESVIVGDFDGVSVNSGVINSISVTVESKRLDRIRAENSFEGGVIILKNFPGLWRHKSSGQLSAFSGSFSHTGTTNKVEVFVLGWVIKVHGSLFFVVSRDLEWNDLELVHAWGHREDPATVAVVVEVFLSVWVSHTSWVTSNNVELSSSDQTGLGVPLHLSWTGVGHRRRPDGDDGGLGVQHFFFQHSVVLFHSPIKGHVVGLRPATERVKEEDGFLVTPLLEFLGSVGHEEGVTVVHGVSKLEDKDGVGA